MPSRALVTGASGFIGSHLVHHLLERSHHPVAMLRQSSKRWNLDDGGAGWETAIASLDDLDALAGAVDGTDVVYHVAGLTSGLSRAAYDRANSEGVANLFEAIAKAKRPPSKFVLVSSLAAAGPSHPDVPRREHHAFTTGVTQYGDSKLGGERIAWEVARSGSIEVSIVRPPVTYGPRDTDFLKMIRSANARVIAQPGFKTPRISAIHVRDLVRGIVDVAERGAVLPTDDEEHCLADAGWPIDHIPDDPCHSAGRGIYYLTDGGRHTLTSMGHASAEALGKRAMTLPVPMFAVTGFAAVSELFGKMIRSAPTINLDRARISAASAWESNHARAEAELAWSPRYDLAAGLEDTVRWLRDRGLISGRAAS